MAGDAVTQSTVHSVSYLATKTFTGNCHNFIHYCAYSRETPLGRLLDYGIKIDGKFPRDHEFFIPALREA